jgi:hypothetical protein
MIYNNYWFNIIILKAFFVADEVNTVDMKTFKHTI